MLGWQKVLAAQGTTADTYDKLTGLTTQTPPKYQEYLEMLSETKAKSLLTVTPVFVTSCLQPHLFETASTLFQPQKAGNKGVY